MIHMYTYLTCSSIHCMYLHMCTKYDCFKYMYMYIIVCLSPQTGEVGKVLAFTLIPVHDDNIDFDYEEVLVVCVQ